MAENNNTNIIGQSATDEATQLPALKTLFLSIRTSYEKNLEDDACLLKFNDITARLTQRKIELADDQCKYIYEELIPGAIKRICSTTTKNTPYALLLADSIEGVITLFNSML